MKTSIASEDLNVFSNRLSDINREHLALYPGDSGERQPVHTVYGGAHLFKSDTAVKVAKVAMASLNDHAKDYREFKAAIGMQADEKVAETVFKRVVQKLEQEALEDFRIDFEDGFGNRPDAEEDQVAVQAAGEVAKGLKNQTLPPFIGIRIKPFNQDLKMRSMRTLDLFITELLSQTGGQIPSNFVVTLPKVTSAEQISILIDLFEMIEEQNELTENSLKMEFMVETPESIFDPQGQCVLLKFVQAARGRCVGAHFGTYDYTASMNIIANYQSMDHQACDFARSFMKVSLAGTGIWLSDGATNIMPVGPHRPSEQKPLTKEQEKENKQTVHDVWQLNFKHIRHSLYNGIYQGWDLHPAQFPVRYGALYSFFLENFEASAQRLKHFMESAAKATLSGEVFDDAATGQGLLNYFLRALNCGAIDMEDVKRSGLTLEEIQTKSFYQILKMRSSN